MNEYQREVVAALQRAQDSLLKVWVASQYHWPPDGPSPVAVEYLTLAVHALLTAKYSFEGALRAGEPFRRQQADYVDPSTRYTICESNGKPV